MKLILHPYAAGALVIASALTMPAAIAADTVVLQNEVRQTDSLSASHGQARVHARLASDFGAFAGSQENAQSLFTGLRNGTPITLNSTTTATGGAAGTTSLTIDPPTRSMGNGNVFISLALAKQQLASHGITEPTPQQIQAALTGGTITADGKTVVLQGVLTQRADGMGWGEIAKSSGTNLGQVVSGLKRHNAEIAAGGFTGARNGITTATGAAVQSNANINTSGGAASPDRGNSVNAPGHNRGSGIVSATGTALGGGFNANANAQAGARSGGAGAGIVTGGGAATGRGGVNAQGQGKGLLKN